MQKLPFLSFLLPNECPLSQGCVWNVGNEKLCMTNITVSYCSFYGKKVDPEPGRCRRTDGKKWRCSKEAYPDSKYCERHMHRGRNRSRKPVESQTMTQSSSTVTTLDVTGGSGSSRTVNFQNLPANAVGNLQSTDSVTDHTSYHLDSIPYAIPSKEYRYRNPYHILHLLFAWSLKLYMLQRILYQIYL